jgi:DNA-binding phage protein
MQEHKGSYDEGMPKRLPPKKISQAMATLAAAAEERGLTAYAIAKTCGLSIPAVQRALDGKVSPTLATVEAIAKALGMVVKVERK